MTMSIKQATTIARKPHTDPATAALRVVHSLINTEGVDVPAKEVSIKDRSLPRTTEQPTTRTKPYYGKSYSHDGPAGNYQGL